MLREMSGNGALQLVADDAASGRRCPNPAIARARLGKRLAEDFPIAAGRFNPARHAWRASLDGPVD